MQLLTGVRAAVDYLNDQRAPDVHVLPDLRQPTTTATK